MKFSIILPCTLVPYKNCASNLEQKLIRAINSVLGQSFDDWELIVISDGCDKTMELVAPFVWEYLPRIRLFKIEKQKIWAGAVRNAGIFKAEGDYIIYIDVDDMWGPDHLKKVAAGLKQYDWVYYNDWNGKTKKENKTELKLGYCGTSTVCHKRSLDVYWGGDSYAHDFVLIQSLLQFKNFSKIATPEYFIQHIPGIYDL